MRRLPCGLPAQIGKAENSWLAADKGIGLVETINSLYQSVFSHLINFGQRKGGNAIRIYLEIESQ